MSNCKPLVTLLIAFGFCAAAVAQSPSASGSLNLVGVNSYSNSPLGRTLWNAAFQNKLSPTQKQKLFYFDHWNTQGTINGQSNIKQINYSLYDDALAYRVSSDSVYVFDKVGVDHFSIDNKKFKKTYLGSTLGSVYLEVVYASPDGKLKFFKRAYVSVSDAEVDPLMMKKQSLNITRLSEYYLKIGKAQAVKVKLSKKGILKHFKANSESLLAKAKMQGLSFRDEEDLALLLSFVPTDEIY